LTASANALTLRENQQDRGNRLCSERPATQAKSIRRRAFRAPVERQAFPVFTPDGRRISAASKRGLLIMKTDIRGRMSVEVCRIMAMQEFTELGRDAYLPPLDSPVELTGRQITAAWLRARCLICGECPDMAA